MGQPPALILLCGPGDVKGRVPACCWSMKMSAFNWSVKVSSHDHTEDTDDEPEGSAPYAPLIQAGAPLIGNLAAAGALHVFGVGLVVTLPWWLALAAPATAYAVLALAALERVSWTMRGDLSRSPPSTRR